MRKLGRSTVVAVLTLAACSSGGSDAEWCAVYLTAPDLAAIPAMSSGSPDEVRDGMGELLGFLDRLDETAPAEISRTIETLVAGFSALDDALGDAGYVVADADLGDIMAVTPQIDEAMLDADAYASANCRTAESQV